MNDSPWFVRHQSILRLATLALLSISMLGTWMFDVIHVPAEYTCSASNVRLHGDFCGMPMSGLQFFAWFAGGFFQIIVGLMTGTFTGRSRELLAGLSILPLIPILITLLLIWKMETRRLQTINLIAWIPAFLLTLTIFIPQINNQAVRLWGLWLYIITALCAIILEALLLKRKINGV